MDSSDHTASDPTDGVPVVETDFLIVGGGIQGITLLHELAAAGARRALLASRDELGIGETLHTHGYMHHGYTMPVATPALARELAECGTWWSRRIETCGSPPVYYGVTEDRADARTAIWDAIGATYEPVNELPDALRGGQITREPTLLFTIRDRAVSMREILDDLAAPLQDRIVRAELTGIDLDERGQRVVQCRFRRREGALVVRPRALLLATGRSAQPLLRGARTPAGARPLDDRCRELNNVRFVPMLLVRGRALPAVTGIFENLSISLHTHAVGAGESMWIVTYLKDHATDRGDFDEARESVPGGGLRESLDRLCALVPDAQRRLRDDLRFSYYVGGKIDHPAGGNRRHVDDCGIANLRVAWPGLWSLSLANAREIAGELRVTSAEAFDPDARPLDPRDFGSPPGVPVGEERRLTDRQSWLRYDDFARALDHAPPAFP